MRLTIRWEREFLYCAFWTLLRTSFNILVKISLVGLNHMTLYKSFITPCNKQLCVKQIRKRFSCNEIALASRLSYISSPRFFDLSSVALKASRTPRNLLFNMNFLSALTCLTAIWLMRTREHYWKKRHLVGVFMIMCIFSVPSAREHMKETKKIKWMNMQWEVLVVYLWQFYSCFECSLHMDCEWFPEKSNITERNSWLSLRI